MSSVCPQCSSVLDPANSCPRCGGVGGNRPHRIGARWQQTFWGRVVIGLILSQGLFYGLRHLLTGILLAVTSGEPDEIWDSFTNLLLVQSVQLFSLFVGGVLAGGGQPQAFVLGMLVGGWNAALALLLQQTPGQEVSTLGLFGQPLLHVAVGGLGGWVGSLIWKPIPSAVPMLLAPQRKSPPKRTQPLLAGKVFWVRVIVGSILVISGSLFASKLFQKMLDVSAGRLVSTDAMYDKVITWELRALAVLLGGALAGASTPNGLKQGLFVGLLSCVILLGVQTPKTDAWTELALWTSVSTVFLAAAGGWFGGQLFPPIIKVGRRGVNAYT
jgi:hypothetical protein